MQDTTMYIFICLCFLIMLASYKYCFSKQDWLFLSIGMTFTLISDYFLLIQLNHCVGVFSFCVVHVAYILRVSRNVYRSLVLIPATLICCIPAFIFFDLLIAAALMYTCFFTQNIVANIYRYRHNNGSFPKANSCLILAGIILFALCDINVLLYNLPNYMLMPESISAAAYILIWVFYLPSQLLLAVSGIRI